MITDASLTKLRDITHPLAVTTLHRGDPNYPLDAASLIEFGRSPKRWRHTIPDPGPPDTVATTLLRNMLLAPDSVTTRYAKRPRNYMADLNTCPRCGSVGPGTNCKKCGTRRRIVPTQKPWSGSATFCATWMKEQEAKNREVINPDTWDDAECMMGALQSDEAIAGLIAGSDPLTGLHGQYRDADSGIVVPLYGVIDFLPHENEVLGSTMALVVAVPDCNPASWAQKTWYHGRHVEAALLQELHAVASDAARSGVLWCLVEKSAPYMTGRRRAAPDLLASGHDTLLALLETYIKCLSTDTWPAFDQDAENLINSWTEVFIEPWMTQGDSSSSSLWALRNVGP